MRAEALPVIAVMPLLPMQESVLFDCDLLGGHSVYTVTVPIRWTGPFDIARAETALRRALERHAAFRLHIEPVDKSHDGIWRQVFEDERASPNIIHGLDPSPVDPRGACPIRVSLITIDPGGADLAITFHHVAADQASIVILIEDTLALYRGAPLLPAGDYGAAVLDLLARHRSASAHPLPHGTSRLPAPPPRPDGAASPAVERTATILENVAWCPITSVARAEGLSPQLVVVAAYASVLARWTGSRRVIIGLPLSLRDALDEPRTAGCLMTVRPLVLDVDPALDVIQLARTTAEPFAALLDDRWASLFANAVVDEEHGIPDRNPLFGTVLAWSNQPEIKTEDIRVSIGAPLPYPARLDLSVLAEVRSEGLFLAVDRNPAKVDATAAGALVGALSSVLRSVPALVRRPIGCISLAPRPSAELATGAAPDVAVAIEAQMIAGSDRPAVIEAACQHSYAALNSASTCVAAWAATLPPRYGPIGIAIPRSFAMVAALVGLLRARRPVALLDPDDPAGIAAAAEAGNVRCILTGRDILVPGVRSVPIADVLECRLTFDAQALPLTDDAAVIVFTSGTTGAPKPVLLRRCALSAHAAWVQERFGLVPQDCVLQFCSIAFDAMLEEVLPTLAAGATLVLRDDPSAASGAALAAFCDAYRITVLDLPTGFFTLAIEEMGSLPASLRVVIIGGEAYGPAALARWTHLTSTHGRTVPALVTTYGPTETTIVVASGDPVSGSTLPIVGDARPGCALYVLDPYLEPCPDGIVGELVIGGRALAGGYLGSPAATAASFLPASLLVRGGCAHVPDR